jgi:Flp pilus assembly protein TadG
MFRVSTTGRSAPDGGGWPTLCRFASDKKGNVAMTFGLTLFVMMSFVMASIDIGHWLMARKMTMEAIDSAVLAGLKSYQSTADDATAKSAALSEYMFNVSKRTPAPVSGEITFKFVPGSNNTMMTAEGNVTMQMPFMQLLNMPTLPLLRKDLSEHAISKSAVGANTGTSLEISVMIDITGSMGESDNANSTKIETVKTAAKSLVDIVVWDDQSQFTSQVAVIPFSEAVRMSSTSTANAARGAINWGATSATPGSEYLTVGNSTFRASSRCVTERTGVHAYTDVAPNVAPVGPFYSDDGSCPTGAAMMALSSDKVALKALIGGLTAGGYTAGQMGTAWAWYTLSPNFNTLWPSSPARPYTDLTVMNAKNKPILQKIAILMTDGDYNTQYCKGVGNHDISCSGDNGSSQSQAGKLCTAMKDKGITVYTIGAQVSANAKTFLQGCATSPQHYYDATDGGKLKAAFIDIANKLVPPYLVH